MSPVSYDLTSRNETPIVNKPISSSMYYYGSPSNKYRISMTYGSSEEKIDICNKQLLYLRDYYLTVASKGIIYEDDNLYTADYYVVNKKDSEYSTVKSKNIINTNVDLSEYVYGFNPDYINSLDYQTSSYIYKGNILFNEGKVPVRLDNNNNVPTSNGEYVYFGGINLTDNDNIIWTYASENNLNPHLRVFEITPSGSVSGNDKLKFTFDGESTNFKINGSTTYTATTNPYEMEFEIGEITSCYQMFSGSTITELISLPTINVQDFRQMFRNCKELLTFDSTKYNITASEYSSCNEMFYNTTNIENINLNFNVGNSEGMFMLSGVKTISSSVNENEFTIDNACFRNAYNLTSIDLSNYSQVNIDGDTNLFYNCRNLETINLGYVNDNIYSSNITSDMFYNCNSLTEIKVKNGSETYWITTGLQQAGLQNQVTITII